MIEVYLLERAFAPFEHESGVPSDGWVYLMLVSTEDGLALPSTLNLDERQAEVCRKSCTKKEYTMTWRGEPVTFYGKLVRAAEGDQLNRELGQVALEGFDEFFSDDYADDLTVAVLCFLSSLKNSSRRIWPLRSPSCLFPDRPGAIWSVRQHDIHTGVDLYCEPGTEVLAMEAGRVVTVEDFTGSRAIPPTPWWNDTSAVLVQGLLFVILYGEITTRLKVGDEVSQGDVIGTVSPVLRKFKGRPTSMMHLEAYEDGTTASVSWEVGKPKPHDLRNPNRLLMAAAWRSHVEGGMDLTQFRLRGYDLESFSSLSEQNAPSRWWAKATGESDDEFARRVADADSATLTFADLRRKAAYSL